MRWKTLTLDEEAYGLMEKEKMPRESFGDMVRRVFMERNADASDFIDELFRDYGGTGMMTPAGRARVSKAQSTPSRSTRPARHRANHAVCVE